MKLYYKIFFLIIIIFINLINKLFLLSIIKFYIFKRGRKYLDKCLQNIYNKRKYYILKKAPKISVIIPIYNCQNTIKFSLSSIQNQKLNDLEIILINDFSKDSSKAIIEKIQKEDLRITLINNKKNMGTLYSRNIGVLASKGKIIFPLDNDDMFFDENILYIIYKESKKYDYDIIGFKVVLGHNYFSKITDFYDDPFIKKKNNMVIYQPNLSFLSINNNDFHIWGKSIKNNLYKKAVNALGLKKYSIYLCNAEDDVMIFILFSIAKSFKFTTKYGLYHLISNETASVTLPLNHILFSKIYFLDILFDFTKNNTKDKEYVVSNAIKLKNIFLSKISLNNKNKKYLKLVLKKIISSNFITKENKEVIFENFKNFTNFSFSKFM